MIKEKVSIVWFRQDLRLYDNLAFKEAVLLGKLLPIYILDDCASDRFRIGSASKVWLHHSLCNLNKSLDFKLNLYTGTAHKIINELINRYNVRSIFCNSCFEPWHIVQEKNVAKICKLRSIEFRKFNSNYLWNPLDVLKEDKSYYKVFTAYKKKALKLSVRETVGGSETFNAIKDVDNNISVSDFDLIPNNRNWHRKIEKFWEIGELSAQNKLSVFIKTKIFGYKVNRDYPFKNHTSLLSPYLHFGEISPVQIWHVMRYLELSESAEISDVEHFLNELIWREFSIYLMYHCSSLHEENINKKFNNFPWEHNVSFLNAWKSGMTGFPIVDAGMRQLWQTGYMHNRVRMIVASFLVKNLNIHWHEGRDWFWDCLVDADLANNSASWQWVAGCGVDAAPYFRIFNPITQGKNFDKEGEYTRQFVPEIQNIPNKYLFHPWTAPNEILQSANVTLGKTYPKPIVDLSCSRNQALHRYKML